MFYLCQQSEARCLVSEAAMLAIHPGEKEHIYSIFKVHNLLLLYTVLLIRLYRHKERKAPFPILRKCTVLDAG